MKNLTFEEAIPQYLNYCKLKVKDSTYLTNERRIIIYIKNYFKDTNIYDLNLSHILNWQTYINSLNLSYNYKSSLFYNLTGFLDYCMLFNNLDKNIAKLFGNFKNNEIKKSGNIWTIEQFNRFIKSINDPVYKTLFNLLYFTGLRKGELLALKYSDIDFENKMLIINKQLTRSGCITSTKTKNSNRIICLDNNILSELNKLKNYYIKKYNNFNESKYVFGFNKYISFTTLKRKKDEYCQTANLIPIKIHEFRHSHAVLLYQNNIPIVDIKNRLGHENISTTIDTYLRYLPSSQDNIINCLNNIRFNNA